MEKDPPPHLKALQALREAVFENPRLEVLPAEEVARQLVLDGYLQEEKAIPLERA